MLTRKKVYFKRLWFKELQISARFKFSKFSYSVPAVCRIGQMNKGHNLVPEEEAEDEILAFGFVHKRSENEITKDREGRANANGEHGRRKTERAPGEMEITLLTFDFRDMVK